MRSTNSTLSVPQTQDAAARKGFIYLPSQVLGDVQVPFDEGTVDRQLCRSCFQASSGRADQGRYGRRSGFARRGIRETAALNCRLALRRNLEGP